MKVISSEKKPIKMWLDDIENGALEQAKNLANLPFIYKHVALMPDCHQGYGMPIGGVIATIGAIIPNAVGVDIGCGMFAVKTSLTKINIETIKKILQDIRDTVPVGFQHNKEPIENNLIMPGAMYPVMLREEGKIDYQLGTLGGGNHFIEIQKGSDGHIWYMIHSGSRNFGKQVCDFYNKEAKKENKRWCASIDPKHDLAFLPMGTGLFTAYMAEMKFALEFAKENRGLISSKVWKAFTNHTECNVLDAENIHHNYAAFENHYGKNVIVHRKGATSARPGEIGIIPGSQGTCSYIVKGLGNKESFNSCSHGAGRTMGRKQAIKELDFESELKKMDGIIHGMRSEKDLDESPGAYKDIHAVMENQKDLVEVLVELKPLAVIKG